MTHLPASPRTNQTPFAPSAPPQRELSCPRGNQKRNDTHCSTFDVVFCRLLCYNVSRYSKMRENLPRGRDDSLRREVSP